MSTVTAAYCTQCRTTVFVATDGSCEYGHPRASLRGIYLAEVDRRTGRPVPPLFGYGTMPSGAVPPVAPCAEMPAAGTGRPLAVNHPVGASASSDRRRGLMALLFGAPKGRHAVGASGRLHR